MGPTQHNKYSLAPEDGRINVWNMLSNIQGVSKRVLQIWKRIEIYTEDIHNVLNCQNVAKHTEFYLG